MTETAVGVRPTGAVNWAWDNHAVAVAVAVVGPDGMTRERFSVEHSAPGLGVLVRRLFAAGVEDVAIERGDGPVVEALRQAGLTAYVIASQQLKNLRGRYGSAGNKDDVGVGAVREPAVERLLDAGPGQDWRRSAVGLGRRSRDRPWHLRHVGSFVVRNGDEPSEWRRSARCSSALASQEWLVGAACCSLIIRRHS